MKIEKNIFGKSAHLSTEQLLNYLRRDMTKEEVHETERHLTDCALCSEALEGLKKLESDTSMISITSELQRLARKRRPVKRKFFSQMDLISLFAVIFLILFLIVVAVLFFWKK